ncbi:hypothetical protein E1B28_003333 [Marasmius oreades]|uniref:alpha,alpha-trehalase n=1 Tax=Marasmius oreades TaxID=181124 RepID=A0A9P7RM01_9AGAR|nr:uncharacterized protein E1B28_003333 [Marasmius oreades]KAG7085792.1 hypothetical protein E1B28_003333 [Marasmius oreades]
METVATIPPLEVPQEPPAIVESNRTPGYWPSSSANSDTLIRVENVSVKYAPELLEVLQDISFTLKAGEQVGLLGRTGSGKSTLACVSVQTFTLYTRNSLKHTADLTKLNLRSTIPVDLNSILYRNHLLLADLHGSSDTAAAERHRMAAASLKDGILDLFWDSNKAAFCDFNLKTNTEMTYIYYCHVLSFLEDAPNAWPPHNYITLRALPSNITSNAPPNPADGQSSFSLIPSGQLDLEGSQLPGQQVTTSSNATTTGSGADVNRLNGTVVNTIGNATQGEG